MYDVQMSNRKARLMHMQTKNYLSCQTIYVCLRFAAIGLAQPRLPQ
jgi:hypothetical protein